MEPNLKDLLLMQRLIDRLNSECVVVSYTLLAEYLLTNYHRLETITMEQLCRDTFVSKSTARRFCKAMGYNNFTDLKKAKQELLTDNYPPDFSVQRDLAELLSGFSVPAMSVQQICSHLRQSSSVFLMLPEHLISVGYDFQQQMMRWRRLIYLVPNIDRHFVLIEKSLNSALIIVLDCDRAYTASLLRYLNQIRGKKICIRAGEGSSPGQDWEQVIHLGRCGTRIEEKYLYSFFLDTIAAEFRRSH